MGADQHETPRPAGPAPIERPGFESALRAELSAVLAGREFSRSPTLSRLLRFLVDQTLSGNGDRLKAYAIAVDGLGRPPDYDAQHDSYPRVQMVRLRKALEMHYAETKPVEGLAIHVTAGSYRVRLASLERAYPNIHGPVAAPAAPPVQAAEPMPLLAQLVSPPRAPWRRPLAIAAAILVVVLLAAVAWRVTVTGQSLRREALTSPVVDVVVQGPADATGAGIASAVRNTLVDGLRRSWTLQVRSGASKTSGPAAYTVNVLLTRVADGRYMVSGQTVDNSNGMVISSGSEVLPGDPSDYRAAFGVVIAGIGGPYGQIVHAETTRLPDSNAGGYPCLLRFTEYTVTHDPELRQRIAICLAKPVSEPRLVAPIFAARAFFALDTAKGKELPDQIERAGEFARRAVEANAEDALAQFAMARIAYVRGDCGAGNYYTERAIGANPNDPLSVTVLSGLSALCGYPGSGALFDRALALRADAELGTRGPLILAAIAQGRFDTVASLGLGTRPARPELVPNYLLCQTLVSAVQGRNDEARRSWQELRDLTARFGQTDDDRLRAVVLSPQLRVKLLELMRARGIIEK